MNISAYNYNDTFQTRNKYDFAAKTFKTVLISSDSAAKKAMAFVKKLKIDSGIMKDGKIHCSDGSASYELNPYYFGVSEDAQDGIIVLFDSKKEKPALKGFNPKKLIPEFCLYEGCGFFGNGQWMLLGDSPELTGKYVKKDMTNSIRTILEREPVNITECLWTVLKNVTDSHGHDFVQLSETVFCDVYFVKFIEQNTEGVLSFKITTFSEPIFIYSNEKVVALLMPMNIEKMKEISKIFPHKTARKMK